MDRNDMALPSAALAPAGLSPEAGSQAKQPAANAKIPAYPYWQADAADASFGADLSRYVKRDEAYAIERNLHREAGVCSALFFSGGRLADHGLRWRPEIARQRPMQTLRALLCSFAPSHEAKTATVALALHHWCEPIPEAEGNAS
jgi:hypothetical protein